MADIDKEQVGRELLTSKGRAEAQLNTLEAGLGRINYSVVKHEWSKEDGSVTFVARHSKTELEKAGWAEQAAGLIHIAQDAIGGQGFDVQVTTKGDTVKIWARHYAEADSVRPETVTDPAGVTGGSHTESLASGGKKGGAVAATEVPLEEAIKTSAAINAQGAKAHVESVGASVEAANAANAPVVDPNAPNVGDGEAGK